MKAKENVYTPATILHDNCHNDSGIYFSVNLYIILGFTVSDAAVFHLMSLCIHCVVSTDYRKLEGMVFGWKFHERW
jgi:hypothetical protein